jgi:hypothetical protein
MTARAAELALFVVQFMTAPRTPAPVFAGAFAAAALAGRAISEGTGFGFSFQRHAKSFSATIAFNQLQ